MSKTYFSLAGGSFTQDWSNSGLITINDNWAGVPSIEGFLGQDITTVTGDDPQTLLTDSTVANDLDVIANQTNPDALTTGGVAEFDAIANPTIALNGSGTADAPHLIIYLNTSGMQNIRVQYDARDLDGSTDNAASPVALQYRIGESGEWTNVPAAFIPDATVGPSLSGLVTSVDVTLPNIVNDLSKVQLRIITTNSAGNDEWIGIDNIVVSAAPASPTSIQNDHADATEEVALLVDDVHGVLANDTSAGPLKVAEGWQQTAGGGQVIFFEDGSYDYFSAAGFSGTDSVQYTVLNAAKETVGTGTLSIDVAATAHVPFVSVGSQLSDRHVVVAGFSEAGNGIRTGAAFVPAVLSGGGYVVAVDYVNLAKGSVFQVKTYDAANNLVATFDPAPFVFNLTTTALSNGNYVVGWDTKDSTGERTTHVQLFDAAGVGLTGPVTVDVPDIGDTLSGIAALPGGGFVVLQFGGAAAQQLYARTFDAAGVPEGTPFAIGPSGATGIGRPSTAVLPDGKIVFAYVGTNGTEVHVQRYDAHGNAIGSEILPATDGHTIESLTPVTVMPNGGFAVSWTSETAPETLGHTPLRTHVQLVDANGALVGTQATRDVDYTRLFGNPQPTVTALANGGFVIDWRGIRDPDVRHEFQAYDANGIAAGPISGFASITTDGVTRVLVYALPDGGFAVGNQATNPSDRDLRIFDNNGNSVGIVRMQDAGDGADFTQMFLANRPDGSTLILYHDGFTTLGSSRDAVQTILFDTAVPAIQTGITFNEDTSATIPVMISIPDPDGSEIVQEIDVTGVPAGWTLSHPNATAVFDGTIWKITGPGIAPGGNIGLSLTPAANASGSAMLTFTVHMLDTVNNSQNQSFPATFNVTVNAVNDAPVITSNGGGATANVNVAEGSTAVTTVTASDVDGPSLAFSIVGGSDAGKFKIDAATGALAFIAAPDFEHPSDSDTNNSYVVQVRASDTIASDDQIITVNVTNVTEIADKNDFNADGKADILWQNRDGTPAVWLMNGTGVLSTGPALANPGSSWHVIDSGDFNGDGKADIVWQNADGTPAVWLMNGTSVLSTGPALANPGPSWHIIAAADFNGDGKSDILWQNADGTPAVWLMNGTGVLSTGPGLANPGPSWHAKDAADFNGDGKADILWQNADGTPAVWLMNGTGVLSTGPALLNPGPSWHAEKAGDFNGDGKADILWQNADGTPAVWLMNGTSVLSTGPALSNPGASWHVKEAADANGDGKADIFWQNDSGTPAVWLMNGTSVFSTGPALANPGEAWHIV